MKKNTTKQTKTTKYFADVDGILDEGTFATPRAAQENLNNEYEVAPGVAIPVYKITLVGHVSNAAVFQRTKKQKG